ncbi:MAG: CapA family protein [Clostridia bacterium]
MKKHRIGICLCCLFMIGCLAGCSAAETVGAGNAADQALIQKEAPKAQQTAAPAPLTVKPQSTPEPTVTPEPEPTPMTITIGAIGDIMMMQSQVNGAYVEEKDAYDFSRSFAGMQGMMRSVDLMCGNFETTLAGKDAGYSKKKTDAERVDTFNAPDSLIDTLKDVGFDFLSTGNNHALDRKIDGLYRTLDVLDEKKIFHKGTARSNEERDTPLIMDVNGIKIGMVAATEIINKHEKWMTAEEAEYAINRLSINTERLIEEVKACRAAGAEYIIAYPHWDKEHKKAPNDRTRACAKLLLESGVDLILGSHPHVVQPIEYLTVERDGQPYTGLIVYSMGNFISNMAPGPLKYGLYVQLSLEKDVDGTVKLIDASYMPTYCFYRSIDSQYIHQVVPAFADLSLIRSYSELTDAELQEAQNAREHVISVCGTDAISVMEDSCWIN